MKNGYASWILTLIAGVLFIVAPVVWAMRIEGKVELNKSNIGHVCDDIVEIKVDIKAIREILEQR